MERGFEYLVDSHGIEGARGIFERICVNLFQTIYGPAAKSVSSAGGDGGIDVLVGDLPKPNLICQCKFFLSGLGSGQRQQIKESFTTVTTKYEVTHWQLCIPSILNQKDLLWWSKWKNEVTADTGIQIELCDGSYLINELKKYDIYSHEFDDDVRNKLDEILTSLKKSKQDILEAIIYADVEGIEDEYNDSIFIKMLESANITDTYECKIDFFNAEISKQESFSKNEVEGLRTYTNLKYKIRSIWRTQYNMHKSQSDGNDLLNRTYMRIEDLDTTTLESSPEYTMLAKKGILHQLANEKKLGWIEDYMQKLTEYVGGEL